METFKSIPDVDRFRDHPLHATLEKLVAPVIAATPNYRPEDDGYLVLIEPGDVDRVLSDLDMPWTLANVPWEGASMRDGFFYAVYLGTDDYGMGIVMPDADWVNGKLRDVLDGIFD